MQNASQQSDSPVWPIKGELWGHQKAALARSSKLAAFAFSFDPGLGKTATVIAEAGRMFLDGNIDTLIVFAPNRVHHQWANKQFPKWAAFPYQAWSYPKAGVNSGVRQKVFEKALTHSGVRPGLRVFCFNFEIVRASRKANGKRAAGWPLLERILATSEKGVYTCIDESHRVKDHTSQQTCGSMLLSRPVSKVRRTLTGTPILQGVQDLFSQYRFLDHRIIGHDNFYSFRDSYCKTKPVPGNRRGAVKIVGAIHEDVLMDRIAPFTSRVLDTDVLDMPERVFSEFEVEMDPAQEKAYRQMEKLMMMGLQKGVDESGQIITATIVLTQLQKLCQIASGFVYDEEKQTHWLSKSKLEAIGERWEDEGEPLAVVWASHIPMLEGLMAQLGDKATRFKTLEDIPVWEKTGGLLVANPASGGTGVDGMQVSNRAYYASNSFSLEHRIQSIKRTHRGDQRRTCFYTDFVSRGTKDLDVLDALRTKRDVGEMTVDKLKEMLL